MTLFMRPVRMLSALCGSAALAAGLIVIGAGSAAAAPSTLNVGCGPGTYPTIGAALGVATAGDTILVCPGDYTGGVVLSNEVSLVGIDDPLINAAGQDNGVQVLASGSTVEGFRVRNAIGEGILVGAEAGGPSVSNVTIEDNIVSHNDRGNPKGQPMTDSAYPQCNANPATPTVPGDCGEGIHLVNAFDSTIVRNRVADNSGGILLSDDTGPTYDNIVEYNNVYGNTLDCGITIAGHTPKVFGGGVYGNEIIGNRIMHNGVKGQGAGVLLATGVPGFTGPITGVGGAVYGNLIQGNYIAGNGLAGVTLHSHAPGEDLNGNTVVDNVIGMNNFAPDADFGPNFVDPVKTGIIVAAVSPVSITIENNVIFNDVTGIWIGDVAPGAVTVSGTVSNVLIHVTNPLVTVG